MKIRELVKNTIKSLLKESLSDRYVLVPVDEYSDEIDEYGIDIEHAESQAMAIARNGGVRILSDKNLSGILLDTKDSKVIGGVWISQGETFSFDIAIDSSYQGMGLSSMLIDSALSDYRNQKFEYDDMGEEFKMEVDVINPKLAQILKNKYGFHVVEELGPDRVLMSLE